MLAIDPIKSDAQLRQAAFDRLNWLAASNGGVLYSDDSFGPSASRSSIHSGISSNPTNDGTALNPHRFSP
jgi:hypothetical protein